MWSTNFKNTFKHNTSIIIYMNASFIDKRLKDTSRKVNDQTYSQNSNSSKMENQRA